MVYNNNGTLIVTRGDAFNMYVVAYTPTGEVYRLKTNEYVAFRVYSSPKRKLEEKPLIEKTTTNKVVSLVSDDTKYLSHQKYYYECTLYCATGVVETFAKGDFVLQ